MLSPNSRSPTFTRLGRKFVAVLSFSLESLRSLGSSPQLPSIWVVIGVGVVLSLLMTQFAALCRQMSRFLLCNQEGL